MILRSFDLNYWYEMDISTGEHGSNREKAICFELNNLSEDTPEMVKVPEETIFIMSIQDAKQLIAWLETVLVNHRINNL